MVGESQRAATIILQQRGLDNSVAEIDLPGATAGQVIGQDPPANAIDVPAPKVSLLVAQEGSARQLHDAWFYRTAVRVGNDRYQGRRFYPWQGDDRATNAFDWKFRRNSSERHKSASFSLREFAAVDPDSKCAWSDSFACLDHCLSGSCTGT